MVATAPRVSPSSRRRVGWSASTPLQGPLLGGAAGRTHRRVIFGARWQSHWMVASRSASPGM
eukprot:14313776-Alexandrium_andersonii.AAC.1